MSISSSRRVDSSLGLRPTLIAGFALTIVIAIITAYQLQRSLRRFKRLKLFQGEPTLPYDVGMLFRVFLAFYTVTYLVFNILYIYTTYAASFGGVFVLPFTFQIGVSFTSQLSSVLFYATFLSIIAYRQRIQLNPGESLFNLKSFLDGLLLTTILALGFAEDGILVNFKRAQDAIAVQNISLVYDVFLLLASLDVAVSSFMAHARLSNAGIQDKIINISVFAVGPIVIIGGVYVVIESVILRHPDQLIDFDALFIASTIIRGVVSVAAISCCLLMGAPP